MSHTREQDRVLNAIGSLIESQIKEGAKVKVEGCFMGSGDDKVGYVSLSWGLRTSFPKTARHEPGIPIAKLRPDKAWPIAAWIIGELKKVRPDCFIDYIQPMTPELIKEILDKHLAKLERQTDWRHTERNDEILAAMDAAQVELHQAYDANSGGLDRGLYLYMLRLGLHEYGVRLFGTLEGQPKRHTDLHFPTLTEIIESTRPH